MTVPYVWLLALAMGFALSAITLTAFDRHDAAMERATMEASR